MKLDIRTLSASLVAGFVSWYLCAGIYNKNADSMWTPLLVALFFLVLAAITCLVGQAEDYLSEYMQEVYSGVFFKEFVLFFGENLQYYIMEESENEEQLTESGSLQKSDIMNESPDSKYEIINDMMISMTLQDDTTLDHLIEEYYRREYLDHRLFTLQ